MIDDTIAARAKEALGAEVATDGGDQRDDPVPVWLQNSDEEAPEYLVTDDFDWEEFDVKIEYNFTGRLIESIDGDDLPKWRAQNATLESPTKDRLTWEEPLEANIINVDSWLGESWRETFPPEFDLGDGRVFVPDWGDVKMELEGPAMEIKKASRQRGKEDGLHHCYVLGHWAYLARTRDHVGSSTESKLRDIFNEAMKEAHKPPEDATTTEYYGGAK